MTAATYLTTPVVLPAPVQGEFPAGVEQVSVAPLMIYGTGAPTTVVAPPGSLYTNISNGAVYSKTGTGTTGWTLAGGGTYTPPLTTKGDLFGFSTVNARLPVGTDAQILESDSASALGVKWITNPNPTPYVNPNPTPMVFSGTGSPEAAQAATVGSVYTDVTTPATPVLYLKTSGTGNTGWVQYPAP